VPTVDLNLVNKPPIMPDMSNLKSQQPSRHEPRASENLDSEPLPGLRSFKFPSESKTPASLSVCDSSSHAAHSGALAHWQAEYHRNLQAT
jgi:hypothetical protein